MLLVLQTGDVIDDLGFEKGYAALAQAGFGGVDWSLDHAWDRATLVKHPEKFRKEDSIFTKSDGEILAYYAEELAVMKKYGIRVSQAHAPFPPYSPDIPDFLDYAIKIYSRMIWFLGQVAPGSRLVVHGVCAAKNVLSFDEAEALNRKLYEALIPALQTVDVTVCMEDLFLSVGRDFCEGHCSDPVATAAFLDDLNRKAGKEAFGLCLDVGHLNLLRKDPRRYLPILGKRIRCLHLHDNAGTADSHLAPFTGNVDWREFLKIMKQIGYDGDLSFETFAQTRKAMVFSEGACLAYVNLIGALGNEFRKFLTE